MVEAENEPQVALGSRGVSLNTAYDHKLTITQNTDDKLIISVRMALPSAILRPLPKDKEIFQLTGPVTFPFNKQTKPRFHATFYFLSSMLSLRWFP